MKLIKRNNKNGHVAWYKVVNVFTGKLKRISHWELREIEAAATPRILLDETTVAI